MECLSQPCGSMKSSGKIWKSRGSRLTLMIRVANKMVNGEQMAMTWHVDDLKVSHKDGAEI